MIKGYLRAKVEEKGEGERLQTKEKVKRTSQVKSKEEEGGEEQKMEVGNKICFRVGLKMRKGRRSGCVKGEGRGTERGRSEERKRGGGGEVLGRLHLDHKSSYFAYIEEIMTTK